MNQTLGDQVNRSGHQVFVPGITFSTAVSSSLNKMRRRTPQGLIALLACTTLTLPPWKEIVMSKHNIKIASIFFSVITQFGCGADDSPNNVQPDSGEKVPFVVIDCSDASPTSVLNESKNFIVNDVSIFSDFWLSLYPEGGEPQPEIDFDLGSLVIVYGGVRGIGNTWVEVAEMTGADSSLHVIYNNYTPEFEGCGGPAVNTSPYCIVQVPARFETATFDAVKRNPCDD